MPLPRRLHYSAVLIAALFAAACGGSKPAPPQPSSPTPPVVTPPTPTAPVTPPPVVISGRVVSTVLGTPVAGATVMLAERNTTTDAEGAFRYELPAGSPSVSLISISGTGLVTRTSQLLTASSRDVTLDVIRLGEGGFDLDYYRRLVRDDFDSPKVLRSLRRWTRAPMIYLKTVDEAGLAVESVTLETVAAALVDDPMAWTGGRFGIAGVERGTGTKVGQSGWITVRWMNPPESGLCGQALVGTEGGYIEFNYRAQNCACGSSRIGAGTVRHELGHAFGFYHTGSSGDALGVNPTLDDFCRRRASARERFHASIAYSRPFGNQDQDNDPAAFIQSRPPEPIVIVD